MSEKRRSNEKHVPTAHTREIVSIHTSMGTDSETLAKIIGIDPKTLRKYYRKELDQALAKANARMGGALYNKGINGDTAAMIFWMKTRARWSERHEVQHTSPDGSMFPKPAIDASKLSMSTLEEILNAANGQDTDKSSGLIGD